MGSKFVTAGIGTLDDDLFLGRFPTRPDVIVSLIETPGLPPIRTMGNTGVALMEIQGLQVICRGTVDDYQTVRTKANDVFRLIGSSGAEIINLVRYHSFEAQSSPLNIGPDDEDRIQIAVNALIWKDVSP